MILLRPVPMKYPITQVYGANPQNYPLTNGHNGIDYGCPNGTPVAAAADGTVMSAGLDPNTAANPTRGYGWHVRIIHPDKSITIYGHFLAENHNGLKVKTGDSVKMGDIIGLSDNTGYSTGPHLHFEYRLGFGVNTSINPQDLIVDEIPSTAELFNVEVFTPNSNVNVRVGPGRSYPIVGKLTTGDIVGVYSLAGLNIWLRIGTGFVYFDNSYLRIEPLGE